MNTFCHARTSVGGVPVNKYSDLQDGGIHAMQAFGPNHQPGKGPHGSEP